MSGGEEIELKLQVGLADMAMLLADPIFADHAPVMRDQRSVYFDTGDRALRRAGLSLRIRTSAGQRVQTIKTESRTTASLFARGEWERPLEDDTPDLTDAPALLLEVLAEEAACALAPAFTVDINRTSVVHADGRDRIELVADQGRVVAGGREGAIVELELELLDGSPAAIFALARRLAARVPVRLGVRTKSERGYALLDGRYDRSVKAEPVAVPRDSDTAALFEAVAGSCLRQFRLNEDRLLETGAPAPLHQARVGLRRLRSALSTFAPMLAGAELDGFQAAFRALAAALGEVRDVDVMIDKIDHEPTLEALRTARTRRWQAARDRLDAPETRALMLAFVEWLSIGAWRERAETAEMRTMPALVTGAGILDRQRRRIKRRGRGLADLDEHDRHRVRIAGKKLRYTAEFFSGLYTGRKATHRRAAFLAALEDLQGALGHLNDLASGRALLGSLGVADPDAILATGRKANRKKLLAVAEAAYEELLAVKRFWR